MTAACIHGLREGMALSSFFLVTAEHRHAEIRRAGYLYLLIAHIGAVGILLSFGVMAGSTGDYTFDAMRASHPKASGRQWHFCLPCLVSAPKPVSCHCTSGCRKRTRQRRPFRR